MLIKLFTSLKLLKSQLHTNTPAYSFIISKMLKKVLKQKNEKQTYHIKPETYTAEQQTKNTKQDLAQDIYDVNYDFFTRQKQIELNKDYRKIREQTHFIPQDVGKGGFDQVVYWSQFAKTPEQIIGLVKVFNRIQMPEVIGDQLRFQQFGDNLMKIMYLTSNFNTLQQFATFGEKFSINQPMFWKKIEEKAIRSIPKTPQQIKDCLEIAYIMSKVDQGQILYSSLFNMFKQLQITTEDKAKLLHVYSNTQTGQKDWINTLTKGLLQNILQIRKQIFIQTLGVFKKLKNLPDNQEKHIFNYMEQRMKQFNFRDLCLVGEFIGHGKLPQQFWTKLQNKTTQLIPKKHSIRTVLLLLDLLTSYSMSANFVRKQFIALVRKQKYKYIYQLPPQILSSISKILYIYQLENQTKDIQQIIQTIIMKTFNYLKNVQIENLIKVLKDYTVTRIGSRQLYIFLQQVADARFQDIRKNKQYLETFCALYENSQLCSPQFLKKFQQSL